jgi:hypothetical protein
VETGLALISNAKIPQKDLVISFSTVPAPRLLARSKKKSTHIVRIPTAGITAERGHDVGGSAAVLLDRRFCGPSMAF